MALARQQSEASFQFTGIHYRKKGGIRHLNLAESDLRYSELLKALADYQVGGLVICESPNLENDALTLQETYNNLMRANREIDK